MKTLILGSGGREHAIAMELARSPQVSELAAAPGNPGIAELATCHPLDLANPQAAADLARQEQADLVVVGPEVPLVAGAVDAIEAAGIDAFGPRADAAELEGSKAMMKDLLREATVPSAKYAVFGEEDEQIAIERCRRLFSQPPVLKTDGLAAGKGVLVPETWEMLEEAIPRYLSGEAFGEAGKRIVVEERLHGEEISLLVLCDGEQAVPLAPAQDYKRLFDGDHGRNTGGMGAFSPVESIPPELVDQIMAEMIHPTLTELRRRGIEYRGILYAGIMLTADGPKLLEYNIRFGDPEAQVVLPRLKSDLAIHLREAAAGELKTPLEWDEGAAVTVTLAAEGYPVDPRTGDVIVGIDAAKSVEDVLIYQAGTAMRDGELVTDGGRVVNVTGLGHDREMARQTAYVGARKISWPGMQYRNDIAK